MINIKVNLESVDQNWKVYDDNVRYFEAIVRSEGSLVTLTPEAYIYWLDLFEVEYEIEIV